MIISHVVAAADNMAIGLNGKLLWHLPLDMQFFTRVTMDHYVLMGRKSWDALPAKYRPLPSRTNVVVSRQTDFKAEGCIAVTSIEAGVELARSNTQEELMIIGGGEIYKQSLPFTDRIYITRVHHIFSEADAYYPNLNTTEWREISKEAHVSDERHKYNFDFVVLERRSL